MAWAATVDSCYEKEAEDFELLWLLSLAEGSLGMCRSWICWQRWLAGAGINESGIKRYHKSGNSGMTCLGYHITL